MEWFLLIYNIFFTGYSFYAWKKYSDKESLWLGILGILVVLLISAKLFLFSFFPATIQANLSLIAYYAWFLVFIGLGLMFLKQKKARRILYGVVFVLFIIVTYLLVVGINGVYLQP